VNHGALFKVNCFVQNPSAEMRGGFLRRDAEIERAVFFAVKRIDLEGHRDHRGYGFRARAKSATNDAKLRIGNDDNCRFTTRLSERSAD
jgi:hypothetical protein